MSELIRIVVAFLLSFVALAWNIGEAGIAAAYVDPIAHIRAQDEAPIVNASIAMSKGSGWLTPKVMGRLFLFKPPLLIWLAALSIRVFGFSLFAIRLPALLFGAAGIAAVFAWTEKARSTGAGILAAGVLLASPFWQTFSRLCLTDVLAASCAALALACVAFDPGLMRRTRIAFAIFASSSILAKSVAGLLPFAALAMFWVFMPRKPKFSALLEIAGYSIVILAPWYVYQVRVHPQWFFAENIQGQIVNTGLHWDRNSVIRDLPILYYLRRLFQMDAVVVVLVACGIGRRIDVRERPPVLLAMCWLAITVAALCAFQAASLPYLVLLLPPMCIVGAICGPRFFDRPWIPLALIFVVEMAFHGQPWSMRPSALPAVPGVAAMNAYRDLHRANDLISIDPDDEFYSMTIPLPHVRYAVLDPSGILPRFVPHYAYLGILVTSQQFLNLPTAIFQERLHQWGVDSTEPIASTITMNTPAEIQALVSARPQTDFYLPSRWLEESMQTSHELVRYSGDRVFLLSRMLH